MRNVPFSIYGFIKRPLAIALSGALCCQTMAQEAESEALEEIFVTSQKRTQILRDVPISIATVDGEKIDKMGIENIEDLTVMAPSMHFTETGLSSQMRIRGIGSDNSQGFEQSVGVYMNGIHRGRAQLFRAPIFDVERVEVMRGPQSTMFGKNSIAGAIDIIPAKPSDEFEAKITISHELEFGTQEFSGMVTGPLTPQLNGRLAVRYYDDPGYMKNTFKDNRDEAQQEEQAIRASLDWSPMENLNIELTAEQDTFDVYGRFAEVTKDEVLGTVSYSQLLSILPPGGYPTFDPDLDFQRQANSDEYSNNDVSWVSLSVNYDTDDYTLTSITGKISFDYKENCDCDFTPTEVFNADLYEDYSQISQEFRIVSADDQKFTWLAGVFFQQYDQSFTDTLNVPVGSIVDITVTPATVAGILAANPAAPIPADTTVGGTGIRRMFEQDSTTTAIFAEGTWHFAEKYHLTIGARYTKEDKEATKVIDLISLDTQEPLPNPIIATIYQYGFQTLTNQAIDFTTGQPIGHDLSGDRSENSFTPSINLSFDATDNIMTYIKFSKGFKAGGFDPRSNVKERASTEPGSTEMVSAFEFEEEEVFATELGSKMRLLNGKLELNVAAFNMDYDDLQVSQFDGGVGFNVGNAKKTNVRGLELDSRIRFSDHLRGSFAIAHLDFEYKDFTNGNCYLGQPADAGGLCDYTGESGVYTPELTLNGNLTYERAITSELDFQSSLDFQRVGRHQVHVNQDPSGEISPYTKLALRFAIAAETWEVALAGRNLLDEHVISYSGNIPLSAAVAGSRSFYSFVQRPKTFTLEGTLRF